MVVYQAGLHTPPAPRLVEMELNHEQEVAPILHLLMVVKLALEISKTPENAKSRNVQSMEDSHLGHDTELVQERVVWGLNHEHDHAPTQDLLMVEKGVLEQPNHHANAVSDIVQSMVAGVHGELTGVVATSVAVVFKRDSDLAPTLPHVTVERSAVVSLKEFEYAIINRVLSMEASLPGHLTELVPRLAVWENNREHEPAPTPNLLMVEKTVKTN